MQDIKYTFDSVSNIKRIKDSVLAIGTLGGGYNNTYNYDGLHRLDSSQGDNTLGHYSYSMDYTASGRIMNKHLRTPSGSGTKPANMSYGYCDDLKPHAVRRMFDDKNGKHFDLRWDDAGNLGQISIVNEDAKFETGRFLFWTEDCYGCEHRLCQSNEVSNRMHAAVDEKYSSYYAYDHSGERRVKLTGMNDLMDVNADYMYTASIMKEPTIYPSAYMVMSNKGYTKHYYAGTERVAARIGGGGLNVIYSDQKLSDSASVVFHQSLKQINDRKLETNDIDCIANGLYSNDKLLIDLNEVPERMKAKLRIDYSEFWRMIADAQNIHHNEPDVYFYHSDHLGSASWITDNGGLAVQHLQYLPYGERYVDQRISGYSERFTFTGKERDEETGYGYFGARYMDHELMTMWLSVDPMADKYPSISPYAYCAWNPVKLVDPDGREVILEGSDECRQKAIEMMSQRSGLSFKVDEKGKVSYSGEAKTEIDKYIAKMIDNTEITVHLTVQESSYDKDMAKIYGGCFDGNKFKPGTTDQIDCFQIVDLITAKENDLLVGESWLGQTIWHEIAEAFEGGRNSIKNKKEAEKAYDNETNLDYTQAHNAASRIFPASRKPIIQTDKMGFMEYSKIIGYEFE